MSHMGGLHTINKLAYVQGDEKYSQVSKYVDSDIILFLNFGSVHHQNRSESRFDGTTYSKLYLKLFEQKSQIKSNWRKD